MSRLLTEMVTPACCDPHVRVHCQMSTVAEFIASFHKTQKIQAFPTTLACGHYFCRAADIPCNVIRGVGKGDEYVLGQQNIANLESAWNAVHVAGEWRLVHPLWSFFQEKQTYQNG